MFYDSVKHSPMCLYTFPMNLSRCIKALALGFVIICSEFPLVSSLHRETDKLREESEPWAWLSNFKDSFEHLIYHLCENLKVSSKVFLIAITTLILPLVMLQGCCQFQNCIGVLLHADCTVDVEILTSVFHEIRS